MQFLDEDNKIIPSVTTEQMKEIDRIAIEEAGPNLFQMMENAGRNLASLTIKSLCENKNNTIIVLAGKGGNGGGGICAARHLANRGYKVKVCVTEPEALIEVSKYQLHILRSTDAKIITTDELHFEKPDLIIDAIVGYNLNREPKNKPVDFIKWANDKLAIKISLDIPTGVNATTGEKYKNHFLTDLTLTLGLPKTGLLPELTGELFLGDIGLTKTTINKVIPHIYSNIFENGYLVKIKYSKGKLNYQSVNILTDE